jgi:hypothetical protein
MPHGHYPPPLCPPKAAFQKVIPSKAVLSNLSLCPLLSSIPCGAQLAQGRQHKGLFGKHEAAWERVSGGREVRALELSDGRGSDPGVGTQGGLHKRISALGWASAMGALASQKLLFYWWKPDQRKVTVLNHFTHAQCMTVHHLGW